jgi:hypothetical protein
MSSQNSKGQGQAFVKGQRRLFGDQINHHWSLFFFFTFPVGFSIWILWEIFGTYLPA